MGWGTTLWLLLLHTPPYAHAAAARRSWTMARVAVLLWTALIHGPFCVIALSFVISLPSCPLLTLPSAQIGRGYFSLDLVFVPCIWGVLIPLLDSFFGRVAVRLSNWENWRLTSTYQAALTAKVFSFRFTNAFLVLYYYIFSDQGSMVRLTTSVASFMIV